MLSGDGAVAYGRRSAVVGNAAAEVGVEVVGDRAIGERHRSTLGKIAVLPAQQPTPQQQTQTKE